MKQEIEVTVKFANLGKAIKRTDNFINKLLDGIHKDIERDLSSVVYILIDEFQKEDVWNWILSDEGISQLGFISEDDPYALLTAMETAWSTRSIRSKKSATLKWGDRLVLEYETMHPAAGLGMWQGRNLVDVSWYNWIAGDPAYNQSVIGYDFARYAGKGEGGKGHLSETGKKHRQLPRVAQAGVVVGPPAGWMEPGGLWRIPPKFSSWEKRFDKRVAGSVVRPAVENNLRDSVTKRLKGEK